MKPHQVREMVNELRDVAVIYSDTHQLRDRIAHVVHKYLAEPQSDLDMLGMLFEENQRLLCEISQLTKREWVGLTDEEILEIDKGLDARSYSLFAYTRAIEAKLKEKNHEANNR
jgi:hypothetical protein